MYEGYEVKKIFGRHEWDYIELKKENYKKYNIKYYNYIDDGEIRYTGKTMGVLGGENGEGEIYEGYGVVNNVEHIATSKKYNISPRNYKILDVAPKELYVNDDTKVMEIDLDGDSLSEYIVCNLYQLDDEKSSEFDGISEIVLYDHSFKKIANLLKLKDDDQDGWLSRVYIDNVVCLDIDNDGIMEILVRVPGYEWVELSVLKYSNGKIEGETDIDVNVLP